MQPQTHSSDSNVLQHRIPWWSELSAAARTELTLPLSRANPPENIDVVVIGGGVAGLSAALSARAAGAEVLLLEKHSLLGYGATGQNAGILSAGVNMSFAALPPESAAAAFWPATTRMLLALLDEAKLPNAMLSANQTGALSLATSKTAANHLAHEVNTRLKAGLRAELWTAEQVARQTEGRLETRTVTAAMWLPDEGRIHPITLLAYLAQKARKAGIKLLGDAEVMRYEESKGKHEAPCWQISLANGHAIQARGLIKAVGPTVEPTARIFALAFAANLPENFPLFWDASPYIYADFRPGNGRLTVSGGRYGKVGGSRYDTGYYKRLADVARKWLPMLNNTEPVATWAVDLSVSAHMIPELRTIGEKLPGVSIEGLGALGVLPGIVLAQQAGELIVRSID